MQQQWNEANTSLLKRQSSIDKYNKLVKKMCSENKQNECCHFIQIEALEITLEILKISNEDERASNINLRNESTSLRNTLQTLHRELWNITFSSLFSVLVQTLCKGGNNCEFDIKETDLLCKSVNKMVDKLVKTFHGLNEKTKDYECELEQRKKKYVDKVISLQAQLQECTSKCNAKPHKNKCRCPAL